MNQQNSSKILQLEEIIKRLESDLRVSQSKENQSQNYPHNIRLKKKTLNREKLLKLLKERYSFEINDIMRRRQDNAVGRLKDLFANSFSTITTQLEERT